jgi:hypothetical protein
MINEATAIRSFRWYPSLVSLPVVLGAASAGSAVVGAVLRLIAASVLCGRMLVSISVAADAELRCAVPNSPLSWDESLTSAVPSARQKASASSVSTRLHTGQLFIVVTQAVRLRRQT